MSRGDYVEPLQRQKPGKRVCPECGRIIANGRRQCGCPLDLRAWEPLCSDCCSSYVPRSGKPGALVAFEAGRRERQLQHLRERETVLIGNLAAIRDQIAYLEAE